MSPNQFIELFPGASLEQTPQRLIGSYNHFCLLVDNLENTLREFAERGLPITDTPQQGLDDNWQYWLTDPDGNAIELMQIMPTSPQAQAEARHNPSS